MYGLSRRLFLQGLGGLALTSALNPSFSFAKARTNKRLAIVILRGGMDGLAAVAPYGDRDYEALRGDLALTSEAFLPLDNMFALHNALGPLHDLYKAGDMVVVHAVASPYRNRSHFDAQNVLELGSDEPHTLSSGWLNRVAASINKQDSRLSMAIGQTIPLTLRGDQAAGSWAPSIMPEVGQDYYSLVEKIYARDPLFAKALQEGLEVEEMSAQLFHDQSERESKQMARKSRTGQAFITMAESAGKWLSQDDGPRLSTLELGGWDTHAGQGTSGGRMAANLAQFANGIVKMKEQLGPVWSDTIIVAMTEFGRTARPNGNKGTDHGTGGAMFIMGGAVRGGQVIADWPGLDDSSLYQNRDLRPTTDIRSVMKGLIADHYNLPLSILNSTIYPGSFSAKPIKGLVRMS